MYDKPGVSQQPEFTTVLETMYPIPFAHHLKFHSKAFLTILRYAQPHSLRVALLGSASKPVRLLLSLSTRNASAASGTDKKDDGQYLQWTGDHAREFRMLLRSYMATLDARLRLSLAAIYEIGPSASARQASSQATTGHVNAMDAFHSPADANLFAITLDSCADTWADPAQSFANSQLPMLFLGPSFGEAAHMWFASGGVGGFKGGGGGGGFMT